LILKSTHIKLADFGLAKQIKCSSSGTLDFNSPEMLLGHSELFSRDIWAFGCTVIELASGVQPFKMIEQYATSDQLVVHLRLTEIFCDKELPKELFDCVDPAQRKRILKYGNICEYHFVDAHTLNVMIALE